MLEPISERLTEAESEPLDDHVIDFLIGHDKEETYLDFKETISITRDYPFSELAKDFLASLNYGGGWVLVGFRDKPKSTLEEDKKWKRQYIPVGLPPDFHVDQADLQTKYNSYCVHPVTILYSEFHRNLGNGERKFAVIYGSAVYIAFGFVALGLSSSLNGIISQDVNLYLRVWGETAIGILLGFLLLVAGLLISSSNRSHTVLGGIIGVLSSIIGVFNSLVLQETTFGVQQGFSQVGLAESSLLQLIMIVGVLVMLFVGFPLGLAGSLGGLRDGQGQDPSTMSDEPATD